MAENAAKKIGCHCAELRPDMHPKTNDGHDLEESGTRPAAPRL